MRTSITEVFRRIAAAGVLGIAFCAAQVGAQTNELVIALSTPITSIDPHFHNLTPNNSLAKHIFETLVAQGRTSRPEAGPGRDLEGDRRARPGSSSCARTCAGTTARRSPPRTWSRRFKRIPNVPNSPASFAIYTRPIIDVKARRRAHADAEDARRRIRCCRNDLATIHIIPKKVAGDAKTEDFNSGKAVIGTGPYKFAEYVSGDRVVLTRERQVLGREAGLGEGALPHDHELGGARRGAAGGRRADDRGGADRRHREAEEGRARLTLASAVSNRIIYLHMDSGREKNSPFVTDKDGKPMEANPLRDPRVRKAISKVIDRDAIVAASWKARRSRPASSCRKPSSAPARSCRPKSTIPDGAKKLLAEAGYPNGFRLTLHTPNNRYVNDEKIAQAVAQFLTRGGIDDQGRGDAVERLLLARLEARVLVPARRLGRGDRRNSLAAALAGRHLRPSAAWAAPTAAASPTPASTR